MAFRSLLTLLLLLLCTRCVAPQEGSPPVFTLGLQSIVGLQWTETLGPYLQNATGLGVRVVPYNNDTRMLEDARQGLLNFTFAGPVQYLCLALGATTSDGVAEVVSSSYLDGSPVERLAGTIIVRAGSGLQSITDLRNRTVLTGPISSLTTFAAQWQLVQGGGMSLFRDTRGVFLQPNITRILPDLLAGIGDAAFVPSSYLERYYPGSAAFRVLNATTSPGFPYLHSTPLYPNAVLSALDSTPFDVRKSVAEALFAVPADSDLARQGMYYGFCPLGAYTQVRTLMSGLGLLDSATQCRSIGALTDLIQCPPGFERVPDPASGCAGDGIPCPAGYQCVCDPCLLVVHRDTFIGLGAAGFAGVLVALALVALLGLFVVVRVCWLRSAPDPYSELCLEGADVIGRSSTGPVFAAEWHGQPVAVKRLFAPASGVRSVFDGEPAAQGCSDGRCPRLRVWASLLLESFWIPTPASRDLARLRARAHLHHGSILPIVRWSRGRFRQEAIAVMPRMMAGTIADLLVGQTYQVDDQAVLSIAGDVANGIAFFHSCSPPIVGKNVKPHHLFLDDSLRTLIGISFRPPNPDSIWAPPECLRGTRPWAEKADAYAFGMLLYTLVHRHPPYEGKNSVELLSAVRDADEETAPDARPPIRVNTPLAPLIHQCWAERPEDRPTFAGIKAALAALQTGAQRAPRPSFSLSGGGAPGPRPSFSVTASGNLDDIMEDRGDSWGRGMFPEHVRRLLQAKLPVPTETHPCVTIFFSDIKGFTEISCILPPVSVKAMLDALYTFMDTCADEHGVHKLETIGDGFVAVTNVMEEQPDHAARMARFALAVLTGAASIPVNPERPGGPTIQLRIGLHTGPVVAGVVGKRNLRYCLFGHTMNIASRMESSGEPGRIQTTREAAAMIARDAVLARRIVPRPGLCDVKGQGKMRTCWVLTDAELEHRGSTDDPASRTSLEGDLGGRRRSRRDSYLAPLPGDRALRIEVV